MKSNLFIIYLLLLCIYCSNILIAQTEALIYPEFHKCKQEDVYFDYKVEDPYRLLENQESEDTKQWVEKENKLTQSYLNKIPNNFTLREQIKRNTEIEYLTPKKKGDYYFVLMSKFNGSELSIYFKKEISDYVYWEELFVTKDLKVNKNEHISITNYEVSANSKYIAYSFDKNGSDWKEIKVADLQLQKNLDDHLFDIKFTSIVWRGNGFYYTKYDREINLEQYKQLAENGKLYYHKLGTTQDKDSLIFKKNSVSSNVFLPEVSKNERYLILNDHNPVQNTNVFYCIDFENKNQQNFMPLFKKSMKEFKYLGFEKDSLLFLTIINNEKKVIAINPQNPLKWNERIRSIENLNVQDVFYHKGKIFELCFYNQQDIIVVFDSKGNIVKKVEIPFGSSVSFKGIDEKLNKLLFSYESYLHPSIFASMDLTTYKFELLEKAKISYDMADYEIKKLMYKSDTAFVPLLLMHKKGLKLDGNNPLLIEFYGGFGLISKGGYDAGKITFIENGGIYAFAMIRGGGEKGFYWHKAGALFNRQKSINDIINGAQFLIDNMYTNASKIAITGGSHGGLMACAVAMQRPDLFAAVVSNVGNFDAFRFEKFTIGSFHADEYGTVKDSLEFLNLKSYSPLHNVKKGIKYPAIMIMTSNYDDRVPPLHSYKMAATLQELASKENPILLRVEKNAGHNGARNYEKYIYETADFYSFILNALRVNKYSNR